MTDGCEASTFDWVTGPRPAGVAVAVLQGMGARRFLEACLRPRPAFTPGKLSYHRLVDGTGETVGDVTVDDVVLADVSNGTTDPVWELSVHGGPEIVRQVTTLARRFGLRPPPLPAADDVDAWVWRLLPLARTELAVRTLLAQRELHRTGAEDTVGDALAVLLGVPRVVMYGLPNVGKSSLLNAFAGRNAAITADLPGTTRDYVSAEAVVAASWGGVLVELVDTPGLRETSDEIEAAAQALARPVRESAALRMLVLDASRPLVNTECEELSRPDPLRLIVWNKSDVASGPPRDCGDAVVSARTGQGVSELGELVAGKVGLDAHVWRRRQRLPFELAGAAGSGEEGS